MGALLPDLFFCPDPGRPELHTLSLHDALPIWAGMMDGAGNHFLAGAAFAENQHRVSAVRRLRSEEHTSELQSRFDLVCRLLLEKKNSWLTKGRILRLYHVSVRSSP